MNVGFTLAMTTDARTFCRCVNDLAAALQAEWADLPSPFIQLYVNSIRCRITACIAQNGGHMRVV